MVEYMADSADDPQHLPFLRRARWGVILALSVISCPLVFCLSLYYTNGWYYCSDLDRWLQTSPCRRVFPTNGSLTDVTFAPASYTLAITNSDAITLWDTVTNTQIAMFPYFLPTNSSYLQKSHFSPDGKLLATAGAGGVQVVDLESRQLRYTIPSQYYRGSAVRFSSDGNYLAFSGNTTLGNGEVRVFDAATGTLVQTVAGRYVLDRFAVQFAPDSRQVLLWVDGHVWVWNIQEQRVVQQIAGRPEVSLDGRVLLGYNTQNGTDVFTYDATSQTYRRTHTIATNCTAREAVVFVPNTDRVMTVASSTYDDLLYPSVYPTMCVWRLSDGKAQWESVAQGYCSDVSSDGKFVAICGHGGVQLWEIPAIWTD